MPSSVDEAFRLVPSLVLSYVRRIRACRIQEDRLRSLPTVPIHCRRAQPLDAAPAVAGAPYAGSSCCYLWSGMLLVLRVGSSPFRLQLLSWLLPSLLIYCHLG